MTSARPSAAQGPVEKVSAMSTQVENQTSTELARPERNRQSRNQLETITPENPSLTEAQEEHCGVDHTRCDTTFPKTNHAASGRRALQNKTECLDFVPILTIQPQLSGGLSSQSIRKHPPVKTRHLQKGLVRAEITHKARVVRGLWGESGWWWCYGHACETCAPVSRRPVRTSVRGLRQAVTSEVCH